MSLVQGVFKSGEEGLSANPLADNLRVNIGVGKAPEWDERGGAYICS